MVSTSGASVAVSGDFAVRGPPVYCCRKLGDVKVAICARRNTVSRGNRTASSKPDPRNVNRFHMDGLRIGSRERYVFKKSGVVVRMKFGRLEWRIVMGTR
jgi:hypothetical protein